MKLPSKLSLRRPAPPAGLVVAPGERVLAWCESADGRVVAGTRDAWYLSDDGSGAAPAHRVPWEQVETADWDGDTATFRLTEVGSWGEPRPSHELVLSEPGPLLELVRERVTASVVLQRHVPVTGRRGVRVIARRAPSGREPLLWVYEFDEGVDPDDPDVRTAAREALARLQAEVGLD